MDRQELKATAALDQQKAALVEQVPAHVLELARYDADIDRLAAEGPRLGDEDLVRRIAAFTRLTMEYLRLVTKQ